MLQVDQASVCRLVKKAPVLLKRDPARLSELVSFLQEVSGMSAQDTFKVFCNWPVMATTDKGLLMARCAADTSTNIMGCVVVLAL